MPNQDVTTALPWQPIYTVERSGKPEVTVYGIVYAWAEDRSLLANAGRALVRLGDTRSPLWMRSLLKPWQLMVVAPTLKKAYPQLQDRHLAIMMASHQGDPGQIAVLQEILSLTSLQEADLQCPACQPMRPGNQLPASPLCHPCAGKHLAHLLYLKAAHQDPKMYLNPQAEPYQLLRILLGYLLNYEPDQIPETVDGCGMPNLALSPADMAQLYHALVAPVPKDLIRQAPEEIEEILASWESIGALMQAFPELIGGAERLDTYLIQGNWQTDSNMSVVAKEGADGLLVVGLGPSAQLTDGAGFLIKLSSGYQPEQLALIIGALLRHVGFDYPMPEAVRPALQIRFHFQEQAVTHAP